VVAFRQRRKGACVGKTHLNDSMLRQHSLEQTLMVDSQPSDKGRCHVQSHP